MERNKAWDEESQCPLGGKLEIQRVREVPSEVTSGQRWKETQEEAVQTSRERMASTKPTGANRPGELQEQTGLQRGWGQEEEKTLWAGGHSPDSVGLEGSRSLGSTPGTTGATGATLPNTQQYQRVLFNANLKLLKIN